MRFWDAVKASASGIEDDGSFDRPTGVEDCGARRAAAFRVRPEELGLAEDWGTRPFGVVVEMGGQRGATTILAFANGDSSLLSARGSGILGRPSHVHVVTQAKKLVKEADGVVALLQATDSYPPPALGCVRFYVLTSRGVFTVEEPAHALRSGESPVSALMDVADELMSEFLQYGLAEAVRVGPAKPIDLLKAFAMVAAIGALTYAAWLIPNAWLRWPTVAIGIFLTIAAAIVPYAMMVAPRLSGYEPEAG